LDGRRQRGGLGIERVKKRRVTTVDIRNRNRQADTETWMYRDIDKTDRLTTWVMGGKKRW